MSKKAEERAQECYPTYEFPSKDINRRDRNIFLQGYEVAEEDLALTWEDVEKIYKLAVNLAVGNLSGGGINCFGEDFYKEVLEKFNEEKQ